MKKLLLAVAAFAVLFTSCAKDETVAPVENEALVSFCVNSPAVATRAEYGNGQTATKLQWAVYDQNGIVAALKGEKEFQLSTTVELKLIQGREYEVLFWAADANAPYTVNWDDKTMTVSDVLTANQESYDAFFKYESLGTVNGALSKTIELRRPFAQLNIATGDTTDAGKAEFTVATTGVTVSKIYSKMSLETGAVDTTTETAVTFAMANKADGTITVGENDYDHIAMNYLLVGDKKLVSVELSLSEENSTEVLTRNYSSVPVQRNYRTNIVGNILTSPAQFNVVILPGFEENEHPFTDEDILNMAAQTTGSFTLEKDFTISSPIVVPAGVKFELNLNGKKITANNEKGEGAIIENAGTLSITGGTLENATENGDAVIKNTGELVLSNVTINGAPIADGDYPEYTILNDGNLTIEEGTEVVSDRGCLRLNSNGATVINGGSFTNVDIGTRSLTSHVVYNEKTSNHKLTINGGTFQHLHTNTSGGVVICNRSKATTEINGGSFSGGDYYGDDNLSDYGQNNTPTPFAVKGGTFSVEPKAKFLVDGYKAIEKDGKYVVVPEEVDAVVSTAEEFTKALSEGESVFLQENINITKLDLTKLTNDVVIDANGKTITTQSNYGVQVTAGKSITLKNAKVEMTVEGNYITYAAGFKIENGDYQGKTISLENCEIRMCNTDWAYAVNMPASVKNLKLVINGCTLEGALAVQCWGDNNTITITNSNLICNYTTSSMYTSYCVALQGDGTNNSENNTLNISGCAFSYSGVDNYNSTIEAVYNHKHNGANTITVDNCTYGEKVEAYK